jgi:hypothetical protein
VRLRRIQERRCERQSRQVEVRARRLTPRRPASGSKKDSSGFDRADQLADATRKALGHREAAGSGPASVRRGLAVWLCTFGQSPKPPKAESDPLTCGHGQSRPPPVSPGPSESASAPGSAGSLAEFRPGRGAPPEKERAIGVALPGFEVVLGAVEPERTLHTFLAPIDGAGVRRECHHLSRDCGLVRCGQVAGFGRLGMLEPERDESVEERDRARRAPDPDADSPLGAEHATRFPGHTLRVREYLKVRAAAGRVERRARKLRCRAAPHLEVDLLKPARGGESTREGDQIIREVHSGHESDEADDPSYGHRRRPGPRTPVKDLFTGPPRPTAIEGMGAKRLERSSPGHVHFRAIVPAGPRVLSVVFARVLPRPGILGRLLFRPAADFASPHFELRSGSVRGRQGRQLSGRTRGEPTGRTDPISRSSVTGASP